MNKQKKRVLLNIGFECYLLPDDAGVAAAIKMLSRAVRVRDETFRDQVIIERETYELSMKYLREDVKIVGAQPKSVTKEQEAKSVAKPKRKKP